jgi:lipoate-protein ligase A
LRDIRTSYVYILERIRAALKDLLPDIGLAGTSDLAAGGLKFSGNSQQRKRSHILHHGTLLYSFDLGAVGRYLHLPLRQPEYRQARDHADFLRNVPVKCPELCNRLIRIWDAGRDEAFWPRERVAGLVAEKYAREEWIRRR